MYLLLLLFGGLLSVAGVLLAASGLSIREHSFDATIITPGAVVAVGGFVLIGLGLALRELQRIERAVVLRQVATAKGPAEPAPPPSPQKLALRPPVAAPAVAAPSATPESEMPIEDEAEAIPAIARIETARVAEETEVSLSPTVGRTVAARTDLAAAVSDQTLAARRRNGATSARLTPRLDSGVRSPSPAERSPGLSFDMLWPKGVRPAPAPAAVTPPAIPERAAAPADAVPSLPDTATEPVTVLKSGVVDGMAYTLYSDGSIEAQLPQGTLRFGSITELRNHIEQSA
jgi:hypothetical protein